MEPPGGRSRSRPRYTGLGEGDRHRGDNRDTIFVTFSSTLSGRPRSSSASGRLRYVWTRATTSRAERHVRQQRDLGIFTDFSNDLSSRRTNFRKRDPARNLRLEQRREAGPPRQPAPRQRRRRRSANLRTRRRRHRHRRAPRRHSCTTTGHRPGQREKLDRAEQRPSSEHATGIANFQIDGAQGPKGMQILHNSIDMAVDGRWAVLITASTSTTSSGTTSCNQNPARRDLLRQRGRHDQHRQRLQHHGSLSNAGQISATTCSR